MSNYKPLLSSAPSNSILNAQAFQYSSSVDTDLRRTFERIRREREHAAVMECATASAHAGTGTPHGTLR